MMLAERGEGLSGGQRQAITRACALLGRPPILILDAPSARMDPQREARLIARLKRDTAERALVIVTHRSSLLALVDRVMMIDEGRVVADWQNPSLAQAPSVVQSESALYFARPGKLAAETRIRECQRGQRQEHHAKFQADLDSARATLAILAEERAIIAPVMSPAMALRRARSYASGSMQPPVLNAIQRRSFLCSSVPRAVFSIWMASGLM